MTGLQEHELMWTRADAISGAAAPNPNTKFFALQVLDGVIKYRWNALPDDQREGIKNFISNLIIKLSTDASRSGATARSSTKSTTCWCRS